MRYQSIRPGQEWLDTNGKPIQAHGASVFYEDGVYYWIGENKEHTTAKNKIWTWGIRVYASRDLYNWEDRGLIIHPEPDKKGSIFHPSRKMDRPHLIYNEKTKKYVLWIKYCDKNHFSIHQADHLMGPYETVQECFKAYGKECGDFDLAVDKKTGAGYLFFESNHKEVLACRLTEDYLNVSGEYKEIYANMHPPYIPEGITHVEHGGKHYILSSGMTGYMPNPSQVAVADDFMGDYKVLGNPHVNDTSSASFNSQISAAFYVAGTDQIITIADRWMPDYVVTKEVYEPIARAIASNFDKSVKASMKDMFQMMRSPVSPFGKRTDTSKARYVWLPVRFEGEKLLIDWKDEWKVEVK